MSTSKKLIYIASPFFNSAELARVSRIESFCKGHALMPLSPREFLVLKPDANKGDRKAVFYKNCDWIKKSDLVLACMDDRDTGTVWEAGYAYGISKPVVAFSENPSDKVNIMLAQACCGWIRGWDCLEKFLEGRMLGYAEVEERGELWDFDWQEAQQWKNEIF